MVASHVAKQMREGSSIRQIFALGQKLRREHGKERVFDLSLGNPSLEPPPSILEALSELSSPAHKGIHRYLPAQGLEKTRKFVCDQLSRRHRLVFDPNHAIISVGAAGGLNCALKAILEPGDKVIGMIPYFPEYRTYVDNHGGVFHGVESAAHFRIDLDRVASALSPNTRALIINSPNNPTGVMYSNTELRELAGVLRDAASRFGHPIYLLSDEPYAAIVFDGKNYAAPVEHYEDTIVISSYSKTLGIPGERLGFAVASPRCHDASTLAKAIAWSQVALGYVNAPAIWQHVLPMIGNSTIDISAYALNRELLRDFFESAGVEFVYPQGAFYYFPSCPVGMSDQELVSKGIDNLLLMIPGTSFGSPGHVRISYCFDTEYLQSAMKALAAAFGLH